MTSTRQVRKRRRPPPPDWDLPVLSALGLKPGQQRMMVIIASVAGVIIAAVVLTTVIASLGGGNGSAPSATSGGAPHVTRPQVFHGWPSPKEFAPMADRGKDAKPLTLKEIFGSKAIAGEDEFSLKLAGRGLESDCSVALWGQELVEQVMEAGCTQAARGIYGSSDGRYVAQYTLLNLATRQGADELVASLDSLYRGGWTLPLAATGAAFTPDGYSEAGAHAMGHYVGLVWVARKDGAEPGNTDDFVNVTLTVRGIEKPLYRRIVSISGPRAS